MLDEPFSYIGESSVILGIFLVISWLCSTECAGAPDEEDEDLWYVVAEYATYQRRAMDTVEIVDDLWQKAQEFMHRAGTHMAVGHVGTAEDLYLFE
jgi:hypothetical protein